MFHSYLVIHCQIIHRKSAIFFWISFCRENLTNVWFERKLQANSRESYQRELWGWQYGFDLFETKCIVLKQMYRVIFFEFGEDSTWKIRLRLRFFIRNTKGIKRTRSICSSSAMIRLRRRLLYFKRVYNKEELNFFWNWITMEVKNIPLSRPQEVGIFKLLLIFKDEFRLSMSMCFNLRRSYLPFPFSVWFVLERVVGFHTHEH